jgi:hypothetical protein
MRAMLKFGVGLALLLPGNTTTLLKLSLDEMVLKSTAIVHCTVVEGDSAFRGSLIYTHYKVNASEVWKGSIPGPIDLAVPGGVANGVRETYAGAPGLVNGADYVLFLWTSKSGLTQVIGLSQGLFNVSTNSAGVSMVSRAATSEVMLDSVGKPVVDSDFTMPLSQLRSRVMSTLGGQAGQ